MKNLFITPILLGLIVLLTNSCTKEPVKGCMDKKVDNYNVNAEESDGSCKYTASFNFYFTPSTGNMLSGNGASLVKFYLNNEYIGYLNTSQTLSSQPSCSATTNVVKKTLTFTSNNPTVRVKGIDEDGNTRISEQDLGTINLKSSNLCNTYAW